MKKLILILVAFMAITATAQTKPSYPTVKLTKLATGLDTDDVLVIGADKQVKKVAKSSIQTDISGKENTIAPGTTSQYFRGDKTWQEFPTIEELLNNNSTVNQSINFQAGLNYTNIGPNGFNGQNSNNYAFSVTPGYIYAASFGASNNSVYITDTNLGFNINNVGSILTINPTSFRIINLPDQEGTLTMKVNNKMANSYGNITLSSVTTTFTTSDGKTVTVIDGVITNVQ